MSHSSTPHDTSDDTRSHSTDDKLVYMANQIGKFFKSQGESNASASIAEHITKFWDPRMRRRLSRISMLAAPFSIWQLGWRSKRCGRSHSGTGGFAAAGGFGAARPSTTRRPPAQHSHAAASVLKAARNPHYLVANCSQSALNSNAEYVFSALATPTFTMESYS